MKVDFAALVAAALAGDANAPDRLYEATSGTAYYVAYQILRDEQETLDVLQNAYVKAFCNLAGLQKPESFDKWLYRIVSNGAKDALKRKKVVLFSDMGTEDGGEIEFEDEEIGIQPELTLDKAETRRLVQAMLEGLSDEQRLVVMMFYFEEMSVKDIALALECPENTVKSRLNYARKHIKQQVLALEEKEGVKLYSAAPFALLLWLLRNDAVNTAAPEGLLDQVAGGIADAAANGAPGLGAGALGGEASGAAGSGAAAAATAGGLSVKAIVLGVAALLVAGGVTAAIVLGIDSRRQEDVVESTPLPALADLAEDPADEPPPAEEVPVYDPPYDENGWYREIIPLNTEYELDGFSIQVTGSRTGQTAFNADGIEMHFEDDGHYFIIMDIVYTRTGDIPAYTPSLYYGPGHGGLGALMMDEPMLEIGESIEMQVFARGTEPVELAECVLAFSPEGTGEYEAGFAISDGDGEDINWLLDVRWYAEEETTGPEGTYIAENLLMLRGDGTVIQEMGIPNSGYVLDYTGTYTWQDGVLSIHNSRFFEGDEYFPPIDEQFTTEFAVSREGENLVLTMVGGTKPDGSFGPDEWTFIASDHEFFEERAARYRAENGLD